MAENPGPGDGDGEPGRGVVARPRAGDTTSQPSPTAGTERLLCQLFAQVLDLTEVGADAGFEDLGGDSIAAIRLVVAARKAGLLLRVRDVYAHQSAGRLARAAGITVINGG